MDITARKKRLISALIKETINEPFLPVKLGVDSFWNEDITKITRSLRMLLDIPQYQHGLYTIYALKDGKQECLYVGESTYCVKQRIRRFFKEMNNCSSAKEDHPGGLKAGIAGYRANSHQYMVKYISWKRIHEIANSFGKESKSFFRGLDSEVAIYVKSKYNNNTYALYGYEGADLKEFLENA